MSDQQIYRILIVDDDKILNNLFCEFLGSRGFETLSATSVETANKILHTDKRLDLILLDYQLGDGVGPDLLKPELMQLYPSIPPVIVISANEDREFLEQCFAFSSVADYLIKPINLSLLALKVKAQIDASRWQKIVNEQKQELEKFKLNAEREESVAKFTYEYLLAQNSQTFNGIKQVIQPCSSFSGDIAIARLSPSGDVYFLLADATGHGLSAAITIMPVVTIFNSMVAKGFHLQQIVSEINRKLVNDTPEDRFVAALVVELNFTKNEIYVWNGAMPTAYWLTDGKIIHRFISRHMALGILDERLFDADVVAMRMPAEGLLFLSTDGLLEQVNRQGEQFGVARLEKLLVNNPDPLPVVHRVLQEHVQGQAYKDDVSICTLEPAAIFAEQQAENQSLSPTDLHRNIDPFSWSVKISGQKLAYADLSPMANHFLQYIGMDQKICQNVFSIIAEMVNNSLDHGILKISSTLKRDAAGFMNYFLKREALLKNLTENDFIELRLELLEIEGVRRLMISCLDSGGGYDYLHLPQPQPLSYTGRGVALIRAMAKSTEIIAPGNLIKVIL